MFDDIYEWDVAKLENRDQRCSMCVKLTVKITKIMLEGRLYKCLIKQNLKAWRKREEKGWGVGTDCSTCCISTVQFSFERAKT